MFNLRAPSNNVLTTTYEIFEKSRKTDKIVYNLNTLEPRYLEVLSDIIKASSYQKFEI